MGRDRRVKTLPTDGWTGLNAFIPPKEKRGLVLIDPPFEQGGEFARLADALAAAWRKWPTGVYAAWAPIKDVDTARDFGARVVAAGVKRVLWSEAVVGAASSAAPRGGGAPLIGTAMLVVNPPFTLEDEARLLLPALAVRLARSGRGTAEIRALAREE